MTQRHCDPVTMDHIIELRKRVALLEKQLENALSYVRPLFEQQRKYLEEEKYKPLYDKKIKGESVMDIVERLRKNCTCNFESTPCGAEEECRNAFDGADEIVKLREALLDAVGFVSRADSLFLRKATTDTLKGIPDGYC